MLSALFTNLPYVYQLTLYLFFLTLPTLSTPPTILNLLCPTYPTLPTLPPYIRIRNIYTIYLYDLLIRFPSTTSPRKGGQPTVATFTLLGQLKSGPLALWAAPPRLGPPVLAFVSYIRIRITYIYTYTYYV